MNKLLKSRFMQTAMSGISRQSSEEGLAAEFGAFQQAIRDLLFGGNQIMETDFILQDTLSVLEGIDIRKKKCGVRAMY